MSETLTISKKTPAEKSQDFEFLRSEGLKYIEQLAHKLWTDYNTHDPGITMLEMLCYAITDLGYRANFDLKDIVSYPTQKELQNPNADIWKMHQQFLSAINVLPGNAVSENDYRKLFIDIEGVKNAWLFKHERKLYIDCKESVILNAPPKNDHPFTNFSINGIYNVKLELETDADIEIVKEKVTRVYHANRNLCEDINEIDIIPFQKVALCADIELETDADVQETHTQIIYQIEQYFAPPIPVYTLAELQEKGIATDKIFEGPILNNGFITDEDLANSNLRTQIRKSDLIRIIMDIDGVKSIKKILMQHCSDNSEFDDDIDISWNLCINDEHLALLCRNKTYFNFYKDILPVKTNRDEVYDTVDALIQTDLDNRYAKTSDDIAIEKGDYPQGIGDYSTMQSNFPLTYGVGPKGIPGPNTTERKAQAKQLKGYLLFFDQILANYFSQLDNVKHLLAADDSIKKTYFSQTVKNLSGIDELVKNYVDYEDIVELSTSKIDNYIERKNKFLDHLIARFAESFNDYVLLMHSEFSEHSEDEIIHDKVAFIREYAPISAARGKAMNLLDINNGIWDTTNVSGFQRRVSRLCGINNYVRRDLSGVNYAMYLEKDTDPVDEYRFRIYDTDGKKIILSSSTKYTSENEAIEELRKAIKLGLSFSSYKILQSKDERYYFNIVDDTDEVIARRIEYFETRELCEQAAWYLIDYLNLKFSDEGMYVIEHPMLLPQEGATEPFVTVCTDPNCAHCDPLDPYSFRISVILPGWTERFENIDFRKFVEKTIRMETPAHILARICWIGKDQMTEFEELYQYYLTAKFKEKVNDASIPTTLHQSFLDKLQELYTIYHEGHLHDCSDDNLDNTIILGGSTLGTIDNEEE